MLLDMLGDAVGIASDAVASRMLVLIVPVLSIKKTFGFFDGAVELDPISASGISDAVAVDSRINQPICHALFGLLSRSKRIRNFFGRPMLAYQSIALVKVFEGDFCWTSKILCLKAHGGKLEVFEASSSLPSHPIITPEDTTDRLESFANRP